MAVSSVTLFACFFCLETLVFIGPLCHFLSPFASLTLFGVIPHLFHWKNVTLFSSFRPKGEGWGEGWRKKGLVRRWLSIAIFLSVGKMSPIPHPQSLEP